MNTHTHTHTHTWAHFYSCRCVCCCKVDIDRNRQMIEGERGGGGWNAEKLSLPPYTFLPSLSLLNGNPRAPSLLLHPLYSISLSTLHTHAHKHTTLSLPLSLSPPLNFYLPPSFPLSHSRCPPHALICVSENYQT